MSSRTLDGKVALITGGSRGLGRAMAVALAAEGATIALVARDKAKLEESAAEVVKAGGKTSVHIADVAIETD
ncbi:MAG TPA: SDR family NAD(P)-dependent oxidoreductase, partial [Bryobacteraceae bacterium]|nr:SDR family NAD(P)-dependent oxidoreductase [Bryobacteraceae bacterium]